MPRISPKLIRDASKISPLLPYYLKANKSLASAHQELKWVQNELPQSEWLKASQRRHQLYPLQYLLGTQPFGALDIKCRENVLIPRAETEEWVLNLCNLMKRHVPDRPLKIVDACTGSGCIASLTKYELKDKVEVSAFDISRHAYELAGANIRHNSLQVEVFQGDLAQPFVNSSFDLVLSNPPYIPRRDYELPTILNGVEESVRRFEPSLALVGELEFYEMLLENLVGPAEAQGFVFELGYMEQARFVRDALEADQWGCGVTYDYAGNIRCVVGWKRGSNLEYLQGLCAEEL